MKTFNIDRMIFFRYNFSTLSISTSRNNLPAALSHILSVIYCEKISPLLLQPGAIILFYDDTSSKMTPLIEKNVEKNAEFCVNSKYGFLIGNL